MRWAPKQPPYNLVPEAHVLAPVYLWSYRFQEDPEINNVKWMSSIISLLLYKHEQRTIICKLPSGTLNKSDQIACYYNFHITQTQTHSSTESNATIWLHWVAFSFQKQNNIAHYTHPTCTHVHTYIYTHIMAQTNVCAYLYTYKREEKPFFFGFSPLLLSGVMLNQLTEILKYNNNNNNQTFSHKFWS